MLRKLFLFTTLITPFLFSAQNNKDLLMRAYTSKDSSDYYFKKAKKAIKNKADEAEYFFCKNAYCLNFGKQDSAIVYGKIAIEKFKKLKDDNKLLYVYNNTSTAYKAQGQNDKATGMLLTALKLAEKTKNEYWIANLYSILAANYHDFEEYKKGVYYGKKGYNFTKSMKKRDVGSITYALNGIAINFDDWNKPDSALYYHRKVFEYAKGKDTLLVGNTYNNIGNTLLKQKKYKEAEKWIKRADKIATANDDGTRNKLYYYERATNYTNLATIASNLRKYDEAKKYFDIAFEAATKSQEVEKLRDYYYQQYLNNKRQKNIANALTFQEEYLKLRDSVFKNERAKLFGDLEAKYQNEKKEKALLLSKAKVAEKEGQIKKKNTQFQILALISLALIAIAYLIYRQQKLKNKQQEQEFQLKSAIAAIESQNKLQEQRLSISRDLHDNIGAQLTFVISSVDNLKFGNQITDSKITNQLTKISDFTKSTIVELRDTIWAMNTNEFSFDDLRSRIFNFIEKAKSAKEEVAFSFTIDPNVLETKLSSISGINIYRTIQEAINNAMKHAHAHNIEVDVKQQKSKIKITITDDGKGFDAATAPSGNGLQNMEKRIEEINGKLSFQSKQGEGTTITILI